VKHVSIRGIKELKYAIIDVTRASRGGAAEVLEEIEDSRVLFEAFEGAVFIHQGLTYLVQEVSHEMRVARVTRVDVNWTTSPRSISCCGVGWLARADSFTGTLRVWCISLHRWTILTA
jgi:DEAD/DEAH box helicase domain-containing protein